MTADVFAHASAPENLGTTGTFVAEVPKNLTTKEDLLQAVGVALQFPGWYGRNWDALSDCIRDLSWVNEPRVVLFHREVPALEDADLAVYLGVLREAVIDWRAEEGGELVVAFPNRDAARLLELAPAEDAGKA